MLLPLHDPVRLAEDAATLSLLSGGRFHLGVGLGYRALEFDAFDRASSTARASWRRAARSSAAPGGPLAAVEGRRFQLPDVTGRARPRAPAHAADRGDDRAGDRPRRAAWRRLPEHPERPPAPVPGGGRPPRPDPAQARIHAGQWAIVDEDPERTWARIGDHALYQLNEYIGWGAFGPPADQVPRFPDATPSSPPAATRCGTADRGRRAHRAAARAPPDRGRVLLGAAAGRARGERVAAAGAVHARGGAGGAGRAGVRRSSNGGGSPWRCLRSSRGSRSTTSTTAGRARPSCSSTDGA